MVTEFQKTVYHLLRQIPKGKVTTYKIIAEKLGTKAYRAVGLACKKNPYAPEVPCHRVVAGDGSLGGYSGGLPKKIELLMKEGVKIKGDKIAGFEEKLFEF